MNNKLTPKRFLKNSIFFIALIILTFSIIFKDNNINNILLELKSAKKIYIFIGTLCTLIYCLCEAFNFWTVLNSFQYKRKFLSMIKYPFVGFFFSSITPSASGGQPMQIYYMVKDEIKVSHASMAIFLEFAAFQIATISLATISFFVNFKYVRTLSPIIKFLIILGIAMNTMIFLFVVGIIFVKKFPEIIGKLIVWAGKKTKLIKSTRLINKIQGLVTEYQDGAEFIMQHKSIMLKIIIVALVQVISLYSVAFWVYRALGFSEVTIFQVIGLQALVYISVSGMPLPGGVGASETVFLRVFKTIYPMGIIHSAMLLSRGISFYIFLAVSGVMILIFKVFGRKRYKYIRIKGK